MEEDFIYWLNELSKEDRDVVGELAANLGEASNSGVNVPQTFVLSKKFFNIVLKESGLLSEIFSILKGATIQDLDQRVEKIRDLILSFDFNDTIKEKIIKAYHKISISGRDYSAIGKKALELISAGRDIEWVNLYLSPCGDFPKVKSILNVKYDDKLIKSILLLLSYLFSKDSLLNIKKMNIPLNDLTYSIIVQKMINSDKSGIVELKEDKLYFYSVWGLVDPLLNNELNPDKYIIDKNTLSVLKKDVSEQMWMLKRDIRTNNLMKKELSSVKIFSPVMSEEEIILVSNVIKKLYNIFQKPLKVNWAIEDNRLFITSIETIKGEFYKPLTEIKEDTLTNMEEESTSEQISNNEEKEVNKIIEQISTNENTSNNVIQENNVPNNTIQENNIRDISLSEIENNSSSVVSEFINDELESNTLDENEGGLNEKKEFNQSMEVNKLTNNNAIFSKTATKLFLILKDVDKALSYKELNFDGVILPGEVVAKKLGKNPISLIKEDRVNELASFFSENIKDIAKLFYPKPIYYKTYYEDKREFEIDDYNKLLEVELNALKNVMENYKLDNIHILPASIKTLWDFQLFKNLVNNLNLGKDLSIGISIESPSLIFILDEVEVNDVAINFNRLFRLLLGVNKKEWEIIKVQDKSIEKSIKYVINKCKKQGSKFIIIGDNIHPESVELFVKMGINAIAVHPRDINSTRSIIESVEKQMILEALRKNESTSNSN